MCIFVAGRAVKISIWHLLGVIQHAHKQEWAQMCDTRWAIFSTEFMGAGWKNLADVMASNISHFWGGNSLQMEHILELRSLSGLRRTKSSRRLYKLHLISLLPLTTQPAEPEMTTTMLMICNRTYIFSCAQKQSASCQSWSLKSTAVRVQ